MSSVSERGRQWLRISIRVTCGVQIDLLLKLTNGNKGTFIFQFTPGKPRTFVADA